MVVTKKLRSYKIIKITWTINLQYSEKTYMRFSCITRRDRTRKCGVSFSVATRLTKVTKKIDPAIGAYSTACRHKHTMALS